MMDCPVRPREIEGEKEGGGSVGGGRWDIGENVSERVRKRVNKVQEGKG